MDKYPDGKMSIEDFINTFKIAFPERPEDKIQKLATNMANKNDKICNFPCNTKQSLLAKMINHFC